MNKKYLMIILGIFLISFMQACVPDPYGDYDSDRILNWEDNCYFVYNPLQTDTDDDGKGDVCDPSPNGFCGDNLCIGDETCATCPEDCLPPAFCGDGSLDSGEQCDNGELNGILCDNSTSSCTYCSSECESITLHYSEQNQTQPTTSRKSSSHKKELIQFCEVNWKCSGWGECINGLMTRQCYDENYCDYAYNKPLEKTGCEIISQVLVEKSKINWLFILIGAITTIILIIILISLLHKK